MVMSDTVTTVTSDGRHLVVMGVTMVMSASSVTTVTLDGATWS
jgi:hypothetical protein